MIKTEKDLSNRPSYAQFLTTACTLVSLDHSPLPWFTEEVKESNDPQIHWLKLSEETKHSHSIDHPLQASEHHDHNKKEDKDKAIAGHYLDHIDVVQQRDQGKSAKKRNKRRRSRSKKTEAQVLKKADSNPSLSANTVEKNTKLKKSSKKSSSEKEASKKTLSAPSSTNDKHQKQKDTQQPKASQNEKGKTKPSRSHRRNRKTSKSKGT